ncbi:MAG: hypothetical protein WBL53_00090 [Pseudonocardiaceae bacterium]
MEPQTGRAIDRYLRLRRSHRLAETPAAYQRAVDGALHRAGLPRWVATSRRRISARLVGGTW